MDSQEEMKERFVQQLMGQAKRAYPQGRISAEDDGVLAVAISTDHKHKRIIMHFGKMLSWVALDINTTEMLLEHLALKLKELKDESQKRVCEQQQ